MPDWTLDETAPVTEAGPPLEEQLHAERELNGLLRESFADLERLYREDIGWQKVGAESTKFTAAGRKRMAALADLSATGNALIKRGLGLRIAYVWGQGVTVTVRDDGSTGQDVNAVWQQFWDDKSNRAAFTSSEAQARYERRLGTTGEQFWALPTDLLTGRVRVRRIAPAEIVDRVCDPEDAETVWFYKRVWNAVLINRETGTETIEPRTTYYPALGYYPTSRPKKFRGHDIRWDAPIRAVAVNCPDDDWRGVGDVIAALPWARMDKEFLEDLAVYMRALTRILGQVTAKSGRAAAAARDALAAAGTEAGAWAATDPNTTMSLVSKSGAQIDADSHRPFATLTATALEVPVTMLLGDPGISGARATAETLDQPTELTFGMRREVHSELFRDIADYVIDMAVLAPRGPLRGSQNRDGDRIVVTLPEGDDRTVEVKWPEYDSTPLSDLIAAIVAADGTEKLPEVETLKLLARALKLDDVDELVDAMTDADGNWVDRTASAGDTAVQRFRRGEDPADV